ncbi:unnamed protein product [Gordionus sp. m RMFG-2023]|uniref:calmodulin-like protein 4 n=1 Tax=Gordionus sp. m RMFG-2023 TaxID=3053472 RepID=UPI0030E225FC
MASHFDEETIETYRECFFLHAKKGIVENKHQLANIMHSLNYCATQNELNLFYKTHSNKEINFPTFLDIAYKYKQKVDPKKEILAAFIAYNYYDRKNKSKQIISMKDLKYILTNFGTDKLDLSDIDELFQELGLDVGKKSNTNKKIEIEYEKFLYNLMI